VALSPRLLDILQYCEHTHKRTLSDTTPLNPDRRAAVGNLPERPVSTVGHQTPGQHSTGGIMQRFDSADQGRNDQPTPSPVRSETPDTFEDDATWETAQANLPQENSDRVPGSVGGPLNPPPAPPRPRISVRTDLSDTSSFTIVDGSDYHTTRTSRRTSDVRKSQEGGGVRNDRGVDNTRNDDHRTPNPRSNCGEGDVREVSIAGPQQLRSPAQQSGKCDHDSPLRPTVIQLPSASNQQCEPRVRAAV